MSERLRVESPAPLMACLQLHLPGWRKSTLKERLRAGAVTVNDEVVRRADHPLAAGDEVRVLDAGAPRGAARSDLVVLFRDQDLVAIDKPAGLLAVSTGRENSETALAKVRALLGPKERLWPVNRLDRETSGVMLFARSHEMREATQANWKQTEKRYLAVVEGRLTTIAAVVDQPLWEDTGLNVRVGSGPGSRAARTRIAIERVAARRTLLDVRLDTGRKHQIRVHLAWLGHPVVGDARYGQPDSRLGLHAFRLAVTHPRNGTRIELEAPVPAEFLALLR